MSKIDIFKSLAKQYGYSDDEINGFAAIIPPEKEESTEYPGLTTQEVNKIQSTQKLKDTPPGVPSKEYPGLTEDEANALISKKKIETTYSSSADTEKKKVASDTADRILSDLESRYFQAREGKGLGYGKGGALKKKFEEWTSFGETKPKELEEINDYNAYRNSVGATFAKAMGDSGNFSKTEQENALGSLPTEFNTREEAKRFFDSMRSKFNLPKREIDKEYPQKQTVQTIQPTQQTTTGLPPEPPMLGIAKKAVDISKNLPEIVKGSLPITQVPERLYDLTMPDTRAYLGKAVKGELAEQKKPQTIPEKVAGLAGPIGTTIARPDIGFENLPPAMEIASGVMGLQELKKNLLPSEKDIQKNLGKVRTDVAKNMGQLNKEELDEVIKEGDRVASNRPELAKAWQQEKESLLKNPTVENYLDRLERWGTAYKTVTTAEGAGQATIKETAKAKLYDSLKRKSEEILAGKSKQFGELTKDFANSYIRQAKTNAQRQARKNLLSKLGWVIGGAAAGIGVQQALSRKE